MFEYKLITYKEVKTFSEPHFFILNKGLNSGKPLDVACPNCFVCLVNDEAQRNDLFWLLFGLWQGKVFRIQLMGSVIPFIRKKELQDVIDMGIEKMVLNPEKVRKNISAIAKIEENRLNVLKQIQLMNELKRCLIMEVLK